MTQQGCPVGAVTDGKLNLTHTLPDNELWDENSAFWTVTKDGQPFDFLPFRKVETQDSRLSKAPTTLDKTETSIKVRIDANTAISARVRYWPKYNDSFITESNPQISPLTVHVQSITGLTDGTTYCYQVLTSDDGGTTWYPISIPAEFTTDDTITAPPVGISMSFPDIAMAGKPDNVYLADNYYVAEFLFLNPSVFDWVVETVGGVKHVTATPVPTAPASAIVLNPPSGGDDTSYLESVINAGGDFVGSGVTNYRVSNLTITAPAKIWKLPMQPVSSSTSIAVTIASTDVCFYESPIDGNSSGNLISGFEIANGSHRAKIVKCDVKDIAHTNNGNMAAVRIRSADDFFVSGCRIENLTNNTGNSNTVTGRANAFFHAQQNGSTSGGYIVQNTAINFQSDGSANDAEFYAKQNFTSNENQVKIFANRCTNAGKRFTKFQSPDGLVLSNQVDWLTQVGNAGFPQRTLRAFVEIITNAAFDVEFRNNRCNASSACQDVILAAGIGPIQSTSLVFNNCHITNNDFNFEGDSTGSSQQATVFSIYALSGNESQFTNCSVANNNVTGGGKMKALWEYRNGLPNGISTLDDSGNNVSLAYNKLYR